MPGGLAKAHCGHVIASPLSPCLRLGAGPGRVKNRVLYPRRHVKLTFAIAWRPVRIWVDADACPQVIKEVLFRAAQRAQVMTTLVANATLRVPDSPFIKTVRVRQGFDVADHWIVQQMEVGDLVITADIPLAAEVITRGAHALDPRGELYSEDNVRERLAIRHL